MKGVWGGGYFRGGYFGSSKAPFLPFLVLGHCWCSWEPGMCSVFAGI